VFFSEVCKFKKFCDIDPAFKVFIVLLKISELKNFLAACLF